MEGGLSWNVMTVIHSMVMDAQALVLLSPDTIAVAVRQTLRTLV